MTPTAGQLYGSQIPTMGMNISNIATHLQKPQVNPVSAKNVENVQNYKCNFIMLRILVGTYYHGILYYFLLFSITPFLWY